MVLGCLLFVKKMKLISVQISPFHSRLIFNSLQFFFVRYLLTIFDLTNLYSPISIELQNDF